MAFTRARFSLNKGENFNENFVVKLDPCVRYKNRLFSTHSNADCISSFRCQSLVSIQFYFLFLPKVNVEPKQNKTKKNLN